MLSQNTLHIDYAHYQHANRILLQVSESALSKYMEQILFRKADSSSDRQDLFFFFHLWNLTFYQRLHNRLPFVPILSQMNTVDALLTPFFTFNYNIFPSTLRPSKWSISLRVAYQNSVTISPSAHACYTLRQSQSPRFHYQKIIWSFLHNTMLLILPFSAVYCHFRFVHPNIFLSAIF